jgi:hypothetical protein
LANSILPLIAPFVKYWSSPKRAARVATEVLIDASGQTGVYYYDDGGHPMQASSLGATRNLQTASSPRRALLSMRQQSRMSFEKRFSRQ